MKKNDITDRARDSVCCGSHTDHTHNVASSLSGCGCNTSQGHSHATLGFKSIVVSSILLVLGLILQNTTYGENIHIGVYIAIFGVAYLFVGFPVLREAWEAMINEKDVFNEFSLMSIATLGAFAIGEFPEAVAVMLFYSVGEYFQSKAVGKATKNIEALLDVRVDEAYVLTNSGVQTIASENVGVGSKIQVRVGDKIPLDGLLLSNKASFNTIALTGESIPQTKQKGDVVLAGMINLEQVIEVETTKLYSDTALSKILSLVQDATERKSKTELLIRQIAKIYTPIVFGLAILLVVLPWLFMSDYVFTTWMYRALTFLVISCPCALVVSIPLGYFGGIGAASKSGILFKGANYLDIMTKVNTIVMDKTGTMTEGVFEVQNFMIEDGVDKEVFLSLLSAVESYSSHPIAKAILKFKSPNQDVISKLSAVKELAGYGISCDFEGQQLLVGNIKLLDKYNIVYSPSIKNVVGTIIVLSIGGQYQGAVLIADKLKVDAIQTVKDFHKNGINKVVMLSGDNDAITKNIGGVLGVDLAVGGLLPDGKVKYIEELKQDSRNVICFVGDGINDAPALALSDVGIAMGAMGADAAIEIADVVIQTDQPSKINRAIYIAKKTRAIVIQNIVMAFFVKLGVLILGAIGIATMWEAVIADVGVTIIAVLNAVRILSEKEQ